MALAKGTPILVGGRKCFEFVHEMVLVQPDPDSYFLHKPTHPQDFYEIMFFLQGEREIRVGRDALGRGREGMDCQSGGTYACGPGDLMLFRPGEPHIGLARKENRHERFFLHIYPGAFSLIAAEDSLLRCFIERPWCQQNRIHLCGDISESLRAQFSAMDRLLRYGQDEAISEFYARSILLLQSINRILHNTPKSQPPELYIRIIEYIDHHFDSIQSTDTLCRQFGISRSGLWRLFCDSGEDTPHAYLTKRRFDNARILLERGSSVAEVCHAVGYSDISHFIRQFRKAYGMTPHQYAAVRGRDQVPWE